MKGGDAIVGIFKMGINMKCNGTIQLLINISIYRPIFLVDYIG
jgi:hypothetical protein